MTLRTNASKVAAAIVLQDIAYQRAWSGAEFLDRVRPGWDLGLRLDQDLRAAALAQAAPYLHDLRFLPTSAQALGRLEALGFASGYAGDRLVRPRQLDHAWRWLLTERAEARKAAQQ